MAVLESIRVPNEAAPEAKSPEVMGAHDSHWTLRKVLASRKPSKVLDAACGQGALAEFLRDRGWDVHCGDIIEGLLRVDGLPFKKINLNRELPYADGSFDVVVCANAMHRLFNPAGAIREFYRVLRAGGQLLLNVNNYASIETRLRFLLLGSIDVREFEEGLEPSSEPEANVRVRIMYPQLAQYLRAGGFSVVQVRAAAVGRRHKLLRPVASVVWLLSRLKSAAKLQRSFVDATNSRSILFGGYYIFIEALRD